MPELRDWFRTQRFDQRPWLVLGKGPTFDRRDEFPLQDFNLLGLNNVVASMPVDVAHIIDMDVLEAVAEHLEDRCRFLLMPRRPHVHYKATDRLLEDFFADVPVLQQLDEQGKLVWYNARTSAPVDSSPVVRVRSFSSGAAVDILGIVGRAEGPHARRRRRPRLCASVRGAARAGQRAAVVGRAVPRDRGSRARARDRLRPARRADARLRGHGRHPDGRHAGARAHDPAARIPPGAPHCDERPAHPGAQGPGQSRADGLLVQRFHIPALSKYGGRAVYLDADMQVFGDLAELWDIPFGEHKVLCTRQDEPPVAWKEFPGFHPGRQMSVLQLDCVGRPTPAAAQLRGAREVPSRRARDEQPTRRAPGGAAASPP